jgi:hypothetical protein
MTLDSPLAWNFAHLAFGLTLFYGIQKFSKEIEEKLNDYTKLAITRWLLDIHLSDTVKGLPQTFPLIFTNVFTASHLSWNCFLRSSIASLLTSVSAVTAGFLIQRALAFPVFVYADPRTFSFFLFMCVTGNIFPDYLSLWKTRWLIKLTSVHNSVLLKYFCVFADALLSLIISFFSLSYGAFIGKLIYPLFQVLLHGPLPEVSGGTGAWTYLIAIWCFIPALFGRLWWLLYVASGLILKCAIRLESGIKIFNRLFDIKKQPLQCIGLVAGTIVALGYWILLVIAALLRL